MHNLVRTYSTTVLVKSTSSLHASHPQPTRLHHPRADDEAGRWRGGDDTLVPYTVHCMYLLLRDPLPGKNATSGSPLRDSFYLLENKKSLQVQHPINKH
jgi:hypothetical protein